jgi:hypothetical protein
MKQIIETKMVEQTTIRFIANDGKEFIGENAEKDCVQYERRLDKEKCEKEFKKLNPVYLNIPFLDWFTEDARVLLITFNSEADFETAIDYYKSQSNWTDCNFTEDKPINYPQTMVLIEGYDWVDNYRGDTKKIIDNLLEAHLILDKAFRKKG